MSAKEFQLAFRVICICLAVSRDSGTHVVLQRERGRSILLFANPCLGLIRTYQIAEMTHLEVLNKYGCSRNQSIYIGPQKRESLIPIK